MSRLELFNNVTMYFTLVSKNGDILVAKIYFLGQTSELAAATPDLLTSFQSGVLHRIRALQGASVRCHFILFS